MPAQGPELLVVDGSGVVRDFADKRRGSTVKRAVGPIDLRIKVGEHVAILGPNGAGKSTLIKLLCGILSPTEGSLRVCGLEPQRSRSNLVRSIGVMFGQRSHLWSDLPVLESARILCSMHGLSTRDASKQIDELVGALSVEEFLSKRARELSSGQRVRAELMACLLHRPTLLLLDEPTVGLDLLAKRQAVEYLKSWLLEAGTTLLLTSHDLSDVEILADRADVLVHGRWVYSGTLDGLRGRERVVRFLATTPIPVEMFAGHSISIEESGRYSITVADERDVRAVVGLLLEIADVRDLTIEMPSIEVQLSRHYTAKEGTWRP